MFNPLVKIVGNPADIDSYCVDKKFLSMLPDLKNMLGISYEIDPCNHRRAGIEILYGLWSGTPTPEQNRPTQCRDPENFYFPPADPNSGWRMVQELNHSVFKLENSVCFERTNWRILSVLNAQNGAVGTVTSIVPRAMTAMALRHLPNSFSHPAPNAGFIAHSIARQTLVIVFRGTATADVNDWSTNFSVGFTKFPQSFYSSHSRGIFFPSNDDALKFWLYEAQRLPLKMGRCFLHTGSSAKYISMKSQILGVVNSVIKHYPATEIYIIGHSMGGALAQICALDLIAASHFWPPATNRIKVWSLAPPKMLSAHLIEVYERFLGDCNTIRQKTRVDSVTRMTPLYSKLGMLALCDFMTIAKTELNRLVLQKRGVALTKHECDIFDAKLIGIASNPLVNFSLARLVSIQKDILDPSIPFRSSFPDLKLATLLSITAHFGSVMNSASIGGGVLNKSYIPTNLEELLPIGYMYDRINARI